MSTTIIRDLGFVVQVKSFQTNNTEYYYVKLIHPDQTDVDNYTDIGMLSLSYSENLSYIKQKAEMYCSFLGVPKENIQYINVNA